MPVSEITYTGKVLQLLQRKPVHSQSYGSPANDDDSRTTHCRIGVRILGAVYFFLAGTDLLGIYLALMSTPGHSSVGSGGVREERSTASGSMANSTISGWFQSISRPNVHPDSTRCDVVPTNGDTVLFHLPSHKTREKDDGRASAIHVPFVP
jgi:hypothetical protein